MMCSLVHLLNLDRSPESLNKYKHCGHFFSLLYTHLMCLDRSPESLNEYKTVWAFVVLDCVVHTIMCLVRSLKPLNEYKHCGHWLFCTLLCTHLLEIDAWNNKKNIKFHLWFLWIYIFFVVLIFFWNVHSKQQ
jgi:hypothetical protein